MASYFTTMPFPMAEDIVEYMVWPLPPFPKVQQPLLKCLLLACHFHSFVQICVTSHKCWFFHCRHRIQKYSFNLARSKSSILWMWAWQISVPLLILFYSERLTKRNVESICRSIEYHFLRIKTFSFSNYLMSLTISTRPNLAKAALSSKLQQLSLVLAARICSRFSIFDQ